MPNPIVNELRLNLAINRGMQMMDLSTERGKALREKLNGLLKPAANHQMSPDEVLFYIHQQLFSDWRSAGDFFPSTVPDSFAREKISTALRDFLWDSPNSLLDGNNLVVTPNLKEKFTQSIARLYQSLTQAKGFAFGNHLTAEFFLTTLLDQPRVKEVIGVTLDFTRLTKEQAAVLHNPETSLRETEEILDKALTQEIQRRVINRRNEGFPAWNSSKITLSGIPFLSYEEEGKTYVVTANGGLIPKEQVEPLFNDHRQNNRLMADFPRFKAEKFLPGTEHLHKKTEIDGIEITDGKAPLFCLDQNILTGLRLTSQNAFKKLYLSLADAKTEPFPFGLSNNETLYKKLLTAAGKEADEVTGKEADEKKRLIRSVEIAYERLSKTVPKMDKVVAELFEDKDKSNNPQFFMSMGGSGSGKSAVKEYAEAAAGKGQVVVASLDDFRSHSDLYSLLIAANHHADDYAVVQDMAGTLRDWVAKRAREGGHHLLYDGSGVEYPGRYDKILAEFKKQGYSTAICGVDATMDKAVANIKHRGETEKRVLPWGIAVDKHRGFPDSFLAAAEDKNVDKAMLFANDRAYGEHHLIAETHRLTTDEEKTMRSKLVDGKTQVAEMQAMLNRADSALSVMKLDEKTRQTRQPALKQDNVAAFRYDYQPGEHKVLTVYESDRFTKFLQKGQMNSAASSTEELQKPSDLLRFLVKRFNAGNAAHR